MEKLFGLALIIIFIGFLLLFIAMIISILSSGQKGNLELGVGGFIGPIPFGFFTSRKIFWIWVSFFIAGVLIYFGIKYLLR